MDAGVPRRGEVWWVVVDMPSKSGTRRKQRPSVIVSSAPVERTAYAVVVAPMSTSTHRLTEFDIPVRAETRLGHAMGVARDGAIFCSIIETVSVAECVEKMGQVDDETLRRIDANLKELLFGTTEGG
jgi:mRNA-degrading endonuclease toxin of MazEF toxin-antitoxin module